MLALYLKQEFTRYSSTEWECYAEERVLSLELEQVLGYKPHVDLMMKKRDSSKRLWIEFEVSRADPVANHIKFATAHLFDPQRETDIFISMISSHIARGRRNLGASAILLMRHIGMRAFQTVLLPELSPQEIKRLNHVNSLGELEQKKLNIGQEIERVFNISETILKISNKNIHFASNILDVIFNLQKWNPEIKELENKKLWGKRTITYFVFDPSSKNFAPSKFCAYVAIPTITLSQPLALPYQHKTEMAISLYSTLDGTDSRFDGRRARLHLTKSLAMISHTLNNNKKIEKAFIDWLNQHQDCISVHPNGAKVLLPPRWFKYTF